MLLLDPNHHVPVALYQATALATLLFADGVLQWRLALPLRHAAGTDVILHFIVRIGPRMLVMVLGPLRRHLMVIVVLMMVVAFTRRTGRWPAHIHVLPATARAVLMVSVLLLYLLVPTLLLLQVRAIHTPAVVGCRRAGQDRRSLVIGEKVGRRLGQLLPLHLFIVYFVDQNLLVRRQVQVLLTVVVGVVFRWVGHELLVDRRNFRFVSCV